MKFLTLLIVGTLALLASCATYQPKKAMAVQTVVATTKIQDGTLFEFTRTYGGKGVTYEQSLDQGAIVFARQDGVIILDVAGGNNMLPETTRPKELDGYSIAEARREKLLLLSCKGGLVRVHFVHLE